ncbi:endonuclease G, mitochondrial-like [Gigantopelta aegis]|uniref:endonuclease G, mitochondrial-like n=1 Tax=Gigantopelta aegis TaxID=1735272 RepID=UPI001B887764|nr:endonuclease G, mitochondrial-like [Gigantopelta aegis]
MIGPKVLPTVSSLSAGIGVWLGSNYERWKRRDRFSKNNNTDSDIDSDRKLLDLSRVVVHASSTPVNRDGAIVPGQQPTPPTASNRLQEIMKYGYPGFDQIRSYDNFVLSYDRRHRNAHWVFEQLTPDNLKYDENVSRKSSSFKEDTSIHKYFRAAPQDYKGYKFDKGHLAAANNHRISQKVLDQTFLLSNISPQVGEGFNRGIWNGLEKYVRAVARKNKNVYVCTGPLYLPTPENGKLYVKYEVIGNNQVAVPTHFFKVLVIEDNSGQLELQSYVLPNQPIPNGVPLKTYFYPVDAIERAAGFLLFDKIPKRTFKKINGLKNS